MKTILLLAGWLAIGVQAQTVDEGAANATQTGGASTPYSIVERGPNHRVWERVTYDISPSGTTVPKVHRYTELATGMHYLKDGQWVESKEAIEILPNGAGAAASQGQHKVYFPPDIDNGLIEMQTPDGQWLRSRPLGISYFDGTNSVLIAELTNSVGQILSSGNQIVYPNAFTDFAADLVCTYRKGGFECDLVFREQPPSPERFGLNPATSRLELLTEFFDAPEPVQEVGALNTQDRLADMTLNFGSMRMGRGKAFSVGDSASAVRVYKSWERLQGRTFLIEGVPFQRISSQLQTLPTPVNAALSASSTKSNLHKVSSTRLLPAVRLAHSNANELRLAKADLNQKPCVVVDYVALNGTTNNFTFRGDTTYCLTGDFNVSGQTVIEGGTVIKFPEGGYAMLNANGGVVCKTGPYRLAVLTSINDDSVGNKINGSTGSPNMGYDTYLRVSGSSPLKYLKFSYASFGVMEENCDVSDVQFVRCGMGLDDVGSVTKLHNVLFTGCNYCVMQDADWDLTVRGEHITADQCNGFFYETSGSYQAYLTNSLFTAVGQALPPPGTNNPTVKFLTSNNGVYQPVGAGNYYLATNSPYRNVGTTNISPVLLAEIRQKTTYPPDAVDYSNVTIITNLTLGQFAQRDTTPLPDLGYHYDPIDYITHLLIVTNATVTVTNGAAIACYNTNGILLLDGSAIVSVGTPLSPNWFVRYSSVQEQPVPPTNSPSSGANVMAYHYGTVGPNGTFRLTKFACPANGGTHFYNSSSYSYSNLVVQDCELWIGGWNFNGPDSGVAAVTLKNNLFYRSSGSAVGQNSQVSLSFSNNLFWGASVTLSNMNTTLWRAYDNAFDSCSISNSVVPTNGYNAYLSSTGRLNPTNAYDVVLPNSLAYQPGLLGDFYQPTNSPLINTGSVANAALVGLYYYTTTTNLMEEGNSPVDIGYHYSGDADMDGLPDWWEFYYFGHLGVDPNADPDDDGLPNYYEMLHGFSPTVPEAISSLNSISIPACPIP